MVKYSIIVPVYKVEKVLPRCIDSILAQTITDFELILVDDGSPDNSGKICDEYASIDSRIIVIHQPNGGVSKARNTGLDIAKGEYIVFVDSDDTVTSDYLAVFDEESADLVVTGYKLIRETGDMDILEINKKHIAIIDVDAIIFMLKKSVLFYIMYREVGGTNG